MDKTLFSIIFSLALTAITVGGDMALKHGSSKSGDNGLKWLILGILIYAASAVGWYWMMKFMKLHVIGVVYAVSFVILLTATSVVHFKEKIQTLDYFAISMAIFSLLIILRPK